MTTLEKEGEKANDYLLPLDQRKDQTTPIKAEDDSSGIKRQHTNPSEMQERPLPPAPGASKDIAGLNPSWYRLSTLENIYSSLDEYELPQKANEDSLGPKDQYQALVTARNSSRRINWLIARYLWAVVLVGLLIIGGSIWAYREFAKYQGKLIILYCREAVVR